MKTWFGLGPAAVAGSAISAGRVSMASVAPAATHSLHAFSVNDRRYGGNETTAALQPPRFM